jgi:hypothetical protein
MHTVAHLQKLLESFDKEGRRGASNKELKATWDHLFESAGVPMSPPSAKSFEAYYKSMHSKKMHGGGGTARMKKSQSGGGGKKKRVLTLKRREDGAARKTRRAGRQEGGAAVTLAGAPLSYGGAAPGLPLATYGSFIGGFSEDGGALGAMPLTRPEMSIPQSAPGYWPTVPADTGSNKVQSGGGGGTRRRKQRGGNLMDSLAMRTAGSGIPHMSTAPPNVLQTAAMAASAQPAAHSGQPEYAAWVPPPTSSLGINPSMAASIQPIGTSSLATDVWKTP